MGRRPVSGRKDGANYIHSIGPDVCRTPMGSKWVPVAYNSIVDLSRSIRTSSSVYNNGAADFTLNSRAYGVEGHEPGTGGGVVVPGYCSYACARRGSPTVYIEGWQAVRDGDPAWINMDDPGPEEPRGALKEVHIPYGFGECIITREREYLPPRESLSVGNAPAEVRINAADISIDAEMEITDNDRRIEELKGLSKNNEGFQWGINYWRDWEISNLESQNADLAAGRSRSVWNQSLDFVTEAGGGIARMVGRAGSAGFRAAGDFATAFSDPAAAQEIYKRDGDAIAEILADGAHHILHGPYFPQTRQSVKAGLPLKAAGRFAPDVAAAAVGGGALKAAMTAGERIVLKEFAEETAGKAAARASGAALAHEGKESAEAITKRSAAEQAAGEPSATHFADKAIEEIEARAAAAAEKGHGESIIGKSRAERNKAAGKGEAKKIPLGFKNREQYDKAMQELVEAAKKDGIADATAGVRGSSITGKSFMKGTLFDQGADLSDIDTFIQTDLPLKLNAKGMMHPKKVMKQYSNLYEWSKKWSEKLGRDITPAIWQKGKIPNHGQIFWP